MRFLLFAVILISFCIVGWTDDSTDKPREMVGAGEIKLVDGSVVRYTSITKAGKRFLLTLENGSMVAFGIDDIEQSSLTEPFGGQPAVENGLSGETSAQSTSSPKNSLGSRKLHVRTDGQEDQGTTIQIIGDGTVAPGTRNADLEKMRQDALARIEFLAELHSESAAKLTTKMQQYAGGCRGSTITHHTTESSGVGLTQGTIDSTYGDSSPGGWTVGNSHQASIGDDSGEFIQSEVNLTTFWTQEEHTTSETLNSETPYCRGLWGEIQGLYGVIGPQFTNAITNARLSFVLDSETSAVLSKYGIGGTAVWMLN